MYVCTGFWYPFDKTHFKYPHQPLIPFNNVFMILVKWIPCYHEMSHPHLSNEEKHIWIIRVVVNVLKPWLRLLFPWKHHSVSNVPEQILCIYRSLHLPFSHIHSVFWSPDKSVWRVCCILNKHLLTACQCACRVDTLQWLAIKPKSLHDITQGMALERLSEQPEQKKMEFRMSGLCMRFYPKIPKIHLPKHNHLTKIFIHLHLHWSSSLLH